MMAGNLYFVWAKLSTFQIGMAFWNHRMFNNIGKKKIINYEASCAMSSNA